ncbi:hypothetical protein BRC68_02000 [Halobacteriales archaeon QH_6_64_20]|nr:MAG: hypothetical protein BRC68_02000 [Halobacteriales archaeon QH_6_64_20]
MSSDTITDSNDWDTTIMTERFRKPPAGSTPATRCARSLALLAHVLVLENRRFSGSRKARSAFRTTSSRFAEPAGPFQSHPLTDGSLDETSVSEVGRS